LVQNVPSIVLSAPSTGDGSDIFTSQNYPLMSLTNVSVTTLANGSDTVTATAVDPATLTAVLPPSTARITLLVTGLQAGFSYRFRVAAVSGGISPPLPGTAPFPLGTFQTTQTGAFSQTSTATATLPATFQLPSRPLGLTAAWASAVNTTVGVSWWPPLDSGGTQLLYYQARQFLLKPRRVI
jgi:hypothetical protein